MLISSKGRYALRVMLDLAEREPGAYVPLREIIRRQEIPQKYLEGIMARLVRAGLTDSLHGKGGGYRLARSAGTITLGDILRAAEGELAPTGCRDAGETACPRADICQARAVWQRLDRLVNDFADGITLEGLLQESDGGTETP